MILTYPPFYKTGKLEAIKMSHCYMWPIDKRNAYCWSKWVDVLGSFLGLLFQLTKMEEFWTSLRCWWTLGIGSAWATPWSDVDIEGPQKGSRGAQDSQHWSLEKMQGRKRWNGEVMMRCSDTNFKRNLTLYVVRTAIVDACPNLSSLWSESAQAEPMEDLVRSSRWEAWVMGSLVCTFLGKDVIDIL